jgi:KTSC domain-containing protein
MPFSFRNWFGTRKRQAAPKALPAHPEPFNILESEGELGFLLGEWVTISSSWIEAAHYDGESRILEIQIKGGAYYQKSNVSEGEAEDFIRAPSQGEWVWGNGWRTGLFLRLTAVSPPKKR